MNLSGKKALVLGMRASGISACNLLKTLGAEVFCYDDFVNPTQNGFVNVKGLPIDEILRDVSLIAISPSIPDNHEILIAAKKTKIPVISELELGARHLKYPQIAVTGTNGKTTTVCMMQKLLSNCGLKVKTMGNIGYPVSQVVLDNTPMDYAIIEASSFQLQGVKHFHPRISVIMNIAPDHMERYLTFNDYVNAKKKIFKNQRKDDFIILNYDDKNVRALASECRAKIIYISLKKQLSEVYIKDNYYFFQDTLLCHIKESCVRGEHNRYNLLAAMNTGALLRCKREHMLNLIRDYTPLPHRVEYVTTLNGKSFYNDSKGTNIHACRYAINTLEGEIGLIMGGSDKNEDYCEFFENIDEKVKYITVTGNNAEKIYAAALKMGFCNISIEDTLKACVEKLSALNDIKNVLFSPSAASFDRYSNYAERGDAFKGIVYEINL
ncbi:MAG: UDP-N-acetylmuramoyl-L-alanine--D-glutamate ligase [Christensenellales bacterium]|jgi:UDP-N-acetylmuramoylalanine--D-glutamate ligase|nr:UDP-N-acetylmuramoyl-L-alanine--D-glutamate ligase [Clostridiales bacterium]